MALTQAGGLLNAPMLSREDDVQMRKVVDCSLHELEEELLVQSVDFWGVVRGMACIHS